MLRIHILTGLILFLSSIAFVYADDIDFSKTEFAIGDSVWVNYSVLGEVFDKGMDKNGYIYPHYLKKLEKGVIVGKYWEYIDYHKKYFLTYQVKVKIKDGCSNPLKVFRAIPQQRVALLR